MVETGTAIRQLSGRASTYGFVISICCRLTGRNKQPPPKEAVYQETMGGRVWTVDSFRRYDMSGLDHMGIYRSQDPRESCEAVL